MKWNIQDRGSLNWRQRMNNCRKRPWKERLLCTVWQRWELSVRPKSFLPFLVTYNVNNKVFMRCFLLTQMRAVPSSNIGNSIPFKISASDAFPVQVVFVTRMAVAGIDTKGEEKRGFLFFASFFLYHILPAAMERFNRDDWGQVSLSTSFDTFSPLSRHTQGESSDWH